MKKIVLLATLALTLAPLFGCVTQQRPWDQRFIGAYIPPVNTVRSAMGTRVTPNILPPYTDRKKHTHHKEGLSFGVDVSLDGKMMVYASTFSGSSPEIYIKGVNDRNPRNISQHVASDLQPRLSPDGRSVVFASNRSRDAYGDPNWDIFIMPASGGGPCQQVTETDSKQEFFPSWSPDGKSIVYSAQDSSGVWEIWVYNLSTQSMAYLGEGRAPDWGPQNVIAFEKAHNAAPNLYAVWTIKLDLDESGDIKSAGGATCVVDGGSEWAAISPSWSPDGTKLVFTSLRKNPAAKSCRIDDIWISDVKKGSLYQLTQSEDPDWAPRWAMDGRIYFSSFQENGHNVWSVRARQNFMDIDEDFAWGGGD